MRQRPHARENTGSDHPGVFNEGIHEIAGSDGGTGLLLSAGLERLQTNEQEYGRGEQRNRVRQQ